MSDDQREIVPNPESVKRDIINVDVLPKTGDTAFKIKATWTEDGREQTGFFHNAGAPLAYQWYIRADASDQTATVFTATKHNGLIYYHDKKLDYWLSQAAHPRLWLYLSTWGYATSWAVNKSGHLVSGYDGGNPAYICIKRPNIISDSLGYICTGNDLGSNYALLKVELIAQ
jgi:hypothetical protein